MGTDDTLIVNTALRLRSSQNKVQAFNKCTDPHCSPLYRSGLYTERKYLHFMGTRAEHLIVINIPAVGILLDLAK